MSDKIAHRCANNKLNCITGDGVVLRVKTAMALGYSINAADVPAKAVQEPSHRDLIMALPEARGRPAAAAALAASQLSLTAAASMLRGLPTESTNSGHDTMALTADENARFTRALGLRCAALRTSADNGSDKASTELRKINAARRVVTLTRCSWGDAFTNVGLDARALITTIVKTGF